MSSKKSTQPSRVQLFLLFPYHVDISRDTQESFNKKMDQIHDERVRILQDNLVFVTTLPHQIAHKNKLTSDLYFGRYGSVSKIIINPSFPAKKTATYQAYVTYSNQLDASLAIVALDGYKLSDRPLKVSFGTTKYCTHFLRGNECSNIECFYLHKIDRKKEVSSGDTRTIFKQQNSKAMDKVLDNLQQIAVRVLESDVQQIQEGFPSLSEMLDYIVDNDYATAQQIDTAFQKANRSKKPVQAPKQQIRVQSVGVNIEKSKQKQPPKLVKSNSHSTMSTPTKMMHEIDTNTKRKEQSKTQKKTQVKIQVKQKQIVGKQNPVGIRQLKLEQKIQKLIIKELMKKNNNDCTSRFVKGVVAPNEECLRLKGIVQRCLITHN